MKIDTFLQTGWPFFPEIVSNASRISDLSYSVDIRQSLQILFTTLPGERLAHPLYGCDLMQFMFKPINNSLLSDMENTVRTAIELYETRINLIFIDIRRSLTSDNRIDIEIFYEISATSSRFNMTIPFYIMEGTIN
jgi:uncharacterized protein